VLPIVNAPTIRRGTIGASMDDPRQTIEYNDGMTTPRYPLAIWRRGFTLLEIMVAIIMVGIFASMAIVSYVSTAEKARDQEAQTMLKLIRNGEQRYLIEYNASYPLVGTTVTDIAAINSALNLSIEPEIRWDYAVEGLAGKDFRATATRLSPPPGYSRSWEITRTTESF
jgi:prepilin-type N-terminal cleavage/methylation domain-containing protein